MNIIKFFFLVSASALILFFNNCGSDFNPDLDNDTFDGFSVNNENPPPAEPMPEEPEPEEPEPEEPMPEEPPPVETVANFDEANFPSTVYSRDLMFSYNADLSDPLPLHKAKVAPTILYIFMKQSDRFQRISYYGGKGYIDSGVFRNNAEVGVSHDSNLQQVKTLTPFLYVVDASAFDNSLVYELYFDTLFHDGSNKNSNFTHFEIQ